MSEITTIGLDLAKHVFQVHGIDAQGTTVLRKRLRRGQVQAFFSRIPCCVVGLEAFATAHYWARELGALGHEVRLMPAQYVKAYIKRNKHDAADAEAICEAVLRPTMRFVPVKTAEQQGIVKPRAFAVFKLIANSNFAGCSIGRSVGLAPMNPLVLGRDVCPQKYKQDSHDYIAPSPRNV